MGYISKYLRAISRWGRVEGPIKGEGQWRSWDGLIGKEQFRFYQQGSIIARQQWVIPTPPLAPFWVSISKRSVYEALRVAAQEHKCLRGSEYDADRIAGHIRVHSWEREELRLDIRGSRVVTDNPVAIRLWCDFLLDSTVKPYLMDYLEDISPEFQSWLT